MATRREFLTVTASTLAGAALTPRSAMGAPKSMTVVRESSFIKPFDDYFAKTLAGEYEKSTGIKINYEAVSVGGMLTRLTTIAETKAGPEIAMTALNWPHLFDKSLVDVSDIAGEIGTQLGGWHENVLEVLVVNKKWKALPWGNIGQLEVYRTDWFKEVGVNKFPETWEDLLAAGRLLKKKGHPFGFELGHGFGDNHGWLYPLLWSYGGREVDKDGRPSRSTPRKPRRPSISAGGSTRRRCSKTCSAGPTSTTTRRSSASRSPARTTRRRSSRSACASSRTSPRSPT